MKTPFVERVSISYFSFFFLLLAAILFFGACSDKDYGRKEVLIISDKPDKKEPTSAKFCKITGGLDTLYVFTNIEYDLSFSTGDKDREWLKVKSNEYISSIGAYRMIVESAPMQEDLHRRTGVLSFTSKEIFLGQFVLMVQGFNTKLDENFEWLRYGSASPLVTNSETLMKDWSKIQKEKNWKSTTPPHLTDALCYGKYEYVKLGNEIQGADLITPYMKDLMKDSVLILAFDAVAFVSEDGAKDNNKLTVNILDGGEFVGGGKTRSLELRHYDPKDRHLVTNMWKNVQHRLIAVTTKESALSGNTRFQFVTGESVESSPENRVFMDNISVFVVNRESHYLAGEEPK